MREVNRVLISEDFGDGCYPNYRDIEHVGDILRIGAAGLAIRFRETDPAIWVWLLDKLEGRA